VRLFRPPATLMQMLAFLLATVLYAAPAPPARASQTIVRAIEARYHRANTLKAVFLERYSDGHQTVRVESGTVYFSRPGRMRWEYESPEEKLFLVDGKHVWFYVPADHTASRADVKKSEDWRTPFALLTGKARLEKLCGKIDLIDPAARDALADPALHPTDPGNSILRCMPRKQAANVFHKIIFEADSAGRLVRVVIRQPGNISTEFRFGNWQENVPVFESKFHFEPPAGVAIVDEEQLARGQP
jgi:outer membrane lipoprotein carrier protein